MRLTDRFIGGITALMLLTAPNMLGAQDVTPDSLYMRLSSAQRSQVTRAELESSLREIEAILSSQGYSSELKAQKAREAELIRRRLTEGDIQPGDVIALGVAGFPDLSGRHPVTSDRTIILPGAGATEISLRNLLRSEVEAYLREQMKRFVRDPLVRAEAQIRISLFGGVSNEGFPIVSSSSPITDVIMNAGSGLTRNHQLEKSRILRNDRVILEGEAFMAAVREARSLDQLNLRAGDEIHVGEKRSGKLPIIAALTTGLSLTWLVLRIF